METNSEVKQAVDFVNHPPHYQTSSGFEAIDVIEAFTESLTGAEATNTGNVIKYICRWNSKNGLEDLKKCRWYLDRLIAIVEKKQKAEVERTTQMSGSVSCASSNDMSRSSGRYPWGSGEDPHQHNGAILTYRGD